MWYIRRKRLLKPPWWKGKTADPYTTVLPGYARCDMLQKPCALMELLRLQFWFSLQGRVLERIGSRFVQ